MTVSLISTAMEEGFATSLSMFLRGAVPYLLWTTPTRSESLRQLCWRPHDGAVGAQVIADIVGPFAATSAVVRSDGRLLVVFDDETSAEANPDAALWWAAFDFDTGVAVEGPEPIGPGAKPSLSLLALTPLQLALTFRADDARVIRVRESLDEGRTWRDPHPTLNNKVRVTTQTAATAFDRTHVLVGQVGSDARPLVERSVLIRSRPLAALCASTIADEVLVAESSQRFTDGSNQLTTTLPGRIAQLPDGTVLLPTRVRQGADDGHGELLHVRTVGAPHVVGSTTLAGDGTGVARVHNTTTYLQGILEDSTAAVVGVVASATHGYAYGYSDLTDTAGGLARFAHAGGASEVLLAATPVFTAAAAPGVLVVATREGGINRLRIYEEGTSTVLASTHQMPTRVRHCAVRLTETAQGEVVVAMDGRLDVYAFASLAGPLQRVGGWPLRSRASCTAVSFTPGGNIVAALAESGVAVFSPNGDQLAGLELSGIAPPLWEPGTTYAQGQLVQPRPSSAYAAQRRYFQCTTAGTTAVVEPPWGPSGSVQDGTAAWAEAGSTTVFVADVLVDSVHRCIYAVGVAGGPAASEGRFYTLGADALL